MAEEDMKNLSPEERLKRLKELEKKRKKEIETKKKEIEKAQKMLRETEKELTAREEWKRKVPIPQVAAEKIEDMSEAEKEILRAHKGVRGEAVEEEEPLKEKKEVNLEETVEREKAELPPELMESKYAIELSQEPMESLYREVKDIYQAVEEKGYVSPEEERKVEYLSAATERKLEDIETGRYSLTEEVAEAALLTRKIGKKLRSVYNR